MNKIDEKEKMISYLKHNDQSKIKEYTNGYLSAQEIADELNVKRHIFYNAVNILDPKMADKRKATRDKIIHKLVEQVEECIPYEYIDFDYEQFYGRNTNFAGKSVSMQKKKLTNSMIDSNCYPEDFIFISLKTLRVWYRNYLMSKIILTDEVPISRAAKGYKMTPVKAYKLRDYMKANNNRILSSASKPVTIKQEKTFLRNIELYEKYVNNHKIKDLAEEYNIKQKNVIKIIESLKYVDDELNLGEKRSEIS